MLNKVVVTEKQSIGAEVRYFVAKHQLCSIALRENLIPVPYL